MYSRILIDMMDNGAEKTGNEVDETMLGIVRRFI